MKVRRVIAAAAVAAGLLGASAPSAFAKPPKCPPGQTATVTVIGTDVVETCRVL